MARPKRTPLRPHLLEQRQRLGLTQEQVAERIGITPEMVRRHEQGLSTPIAFYQARYCKLYGADEFALGFRPATASAILPASSTVAIGDALSTLSDFEELLTRAKGVTLASVADLQHQVDGLRALDRQLGSPAALEPTRLLTRTMQELMEHVAVGSTRSGLAVTSQAPG